LRFAYGRPQPERQVSCLQIIGLVLTGGVDKAMLMSLDKEIQNVPEGAFRWREERVAGDSKLSVLA